ncbi:MAG: prenyltransferase [Syntrophaceae bacterium]|nr:prenyltransferase [Syntrophaceae bacterium]
MSDKQTVGIAWGEWFSLSRPPFHTVGVLPFFLGTLLAWRMDHLFHFGIFALGTLAVIMIMLSTYQAGEYFDIEEDRISKAIFPSRFAGGSGVMPAGRVSEKVPLWTSIIAFIIAGAIGLLLQFHYRTGPYTLLMGCFGALSGFFYSTRPVRLVETGLGEFFIGICYGWLPVATAFYIQTGYVHPFIHWLALPIALSIFNVILLNEFPDYEADQRVGKRNLLVRLGKTWGKGIYIAFAVLSWGGMFLSLRAGVPHIALYLYMPVVLTSLIVMGMLVANADRNRKLLETMCGLTIAVNLGTTASYMLAFWK